MSGAILEHVNVTVSDPNATANLLCELFDWKIRWEGAAIDNGYTVHVGNKDAYVAVYSQGDPTAPKGSSYGRRGGLNHLGILVEDLSATEARVIAAGLKPFNHQEYAPGKRFYFLDDNQIEYEVLSYSDTANR